MELAAVVHVDLPVPFVSHTGYSSIGRASDCRELQESDGPWFDSGWPDALIWVFSMGFTLFPVQERTR